MVLYLEPSHVDWMTNERLGRVLLALKDRIPLKLSAEIEKSKKKGVQNQKNSVDVYRGVDYQIAYYFRKAGKKHVILLKEKTVYYPELPEQAKLSPPVPAADYPSLDAEAAAVIEDAPSAPKRTRTDADTVDLTEDEHAEERASKRSNTQSDTGAAPEILHVKDEPDDERAAALLRDAAPAAEEDLKPNFQDLMMNDVKPEVKVKYNGYSIFNRSLVVIVEPYPALPLNDCTRAPMVPADRPQLSATPLPEMFRQNRERSANSVSASPAPYSSRRGGQPLFRSATTPMREDDDDDDQDSDVSAQEREMSLGSAWDPAREDSQDLPDLDELLSARKNLRQDSEL